MRFPRTLRHSIAVVTGGLVLLSGARAASAHVDVDADDSGAGETTLLTFSVAHGCEGSPTTEIRIQIPETIPTVVPTINPGWDVDKVMEQLATPITDAHSDAITERVSEVVYTAKTPLLDGYRDTFVLQLRLPDDAAGTTVYFPTIQTCEQGATAWIEVPQDGQSAESLENPAPGVAVDAPDDASADDDNDDD